MTFILNATDLRTGHPISVTSCSVCGQLVVADVDEDGPCATWLVDGHGQWWGENKRGVPCTDIVSCGCSRLLGTSARTAPAEGSNSRAGVASAGFAKCEGAKTRPKARSEKSGGAQKCRAERKRHAARKGVV